MDQGIMETSYWIHREILGERISKEVKTLTAIMQSKLHPFQMCIMCLKKKANFTHLDNFLSGSATHIWFFQCRLLLFYYFIILSLFLDTS